MFSPLDRDIVVMKCYIKFKISGFYVRKVMDYIRELREEPAGM
jgi:hypothetical protein